MKEPLYDKPWKRTIRDTAEERDAGYARIRDHYGGTSVQLFWDTGSEEERDGMLMMIVGGKKVVVDADQLRKYLRWL